MDLLTIASESHRELQHRFLLSSKVQEYRIFNGHMDQVCETGEYRSRGWCEMGQAKLEFILSYLQSGIRPDGHWFVFADADITFLRPSKQVFFDEIRAIGGQDILLQDDGREFCSGLFVCKVSDRTRHLFATSLEIAVEMARENERLGRGYSAADQAALNAAITATRSRASMLSHRFLNWHHLCSTELWKPGMSFRIPENAVAFHANWTIGIDNKVKLLQYVVDEVSNEAPSIST